MTTDNTRDSKWKLLFHPTTLFVGLMTVLISMASMAMSSGNDAVNRAIDSSEASANKAIDASEAASKTAIDASTASAKTAIDASKLAQESSEDAATKSIEASSLAQKSSEEALIKAREALDAVLKVKTDLDVHSARQNGSFESINSQLGTIKGYNSTLRGDLRERDALRELKNAEQRKALDARLTEQRKILDLLLRHIGDPR